MPRIPTPHRKYRNVPTVVEGIRFDSKKEAKRYCELRLLERNEDIACLETQPFFALEVNSQKICKYVADFSYRQHGRLIVEDVKGVKTPAYRLKKKLMKAIYGIEIQEV